MESPQKPNERFKFPSFDHFVIRTEQKENPRRMPFISCSITSESWQTNFNNQLRNSLRELLQTASVNKEVINTEPSRDFLRTAWQRDNYLYFNGVYFPYRWIDTKGRNRPEREAYVLSRAGIKEITIDTGRFFTDRNEGLFTVGEGGIYFPDHDNNTLFISDGIIAEEGSLSQKELYEKITELHKKIFGENIEMIILPQPDNTNHLDTHLSVIPNTKIILIENSYYDKLQQSANLEQLRKLGYEPIQISSTNMQCPLNILYLEKSLGKICAFINPRIPESVKEILRAHKIDVYELDVVIAEDLDNHLGGIRCITNELHTKDPAFLRKLGLNKTDLPG
jgi:N-dimethylarginine dimethylaminohydrolase